MSYKKLLVTSPCSLNIKDNQLCYKKDGKELNFSLEDVEVVVMENNQSSITSLALAKLAESNIAFFTCNDYHMPNGVLTPFFNSARAAETTYAQVSMKRNLADRLWQQIIIYKLTNQAEVLKKLKNHSYAKLKNLAKTVKTGDEGNKEGIGAKIYWQEILGRNITRRHENKINKALNYGYAILKGIIARDLAMAGFIPTIGLHHSNKLSQDNLTFDILEPYRPILDNHILNNIEHLKVEGNELNPQEKLKILEFLDINCSLNKQRIKISDATKLTISSLLNSIKENNYKLLIYPKL